jgi:ribosome maturation factor RimP
MCRIVTREQIEGKNEFMGTIVNSTEEQVEIRGIIDVFTIPIYAIKKANLEFEL